MRPDYSKITDDLFTHDPIVNKEKDIVVTNKPISFWKDAWLRLRKNRGALIGLLLILLIIIPLSCIICF